MDNPNGPLITHATIAAAEPLGCPTLRNGQAKHVPPVRF
jgi:hypothetical protein